MVLDRSNVGYVAGYGIIPAFCMLVGSLVSSFMVIPPPKVVFALQHLAGGIILSAIAIEFVPVLIGGNNDPWEIPVIVVAFLGGAGMLVLIGGFMDEAENGGDGEEAEEKTPQELLEVATSAERKSEEYKVTSFKEFQKKKNEMKMSSDYVAMGGGSQAEGRKSKHRKSMVTRAFENVNITTEQRKSLAPVSRTTIAERASLVAASTKSVGKYPLTLAIAVALDSFLDGTFIGISFAASQSTGNLYGGFVLALSLSIEMTFLGLTFAIAIPQNSTFTTKIMSILMGPAILFAATFFGAGAGLALSSYTVPFQALTAFGASALLFTVGEELLVTAHEDSEEHEWWIDFTTICGFLVTIVVDKLIKNAGF